MVHRVAQATKDHRESKDHRVQRYVAYSFQYCAVMVLAWCAGQCRSARSEWAPRTQRTSGNKMFTSVAMSM